MKQAGIIIIQSLLMCLSFFLALPAEAVAVGLMRPGQTLGEGVKQESWLQLDLFDQNFDILGYSNKLGSSARPDRLQMLRLGSNYRLDDHWVLRGEVMMGEQSIVRTSEPKQLNPAFYGLQVVLQWRLTADSWRVEAGFQRHQVNDQGFSIYQTGTTTLIAAPGQRLASSSASDNSWFIRIAAPYDWHFRAVASAQRNKVQASYVVYDPAVRPLVASQIPQSAPWQENQFDLLLGLDLPLFSSWMLGLDLRHVAIKRSGYRPAASGQDFNSSDSIDSWLSWQHREGVAFTVHCHANSHFMLGDIPAFYNNGVSHKFRYPFAWVSLNMTYSY